MTILNGGGVSGVSPQKFDEDIGEVKNDLFTIKTGVADIQSDLTQLSTDVNDAVDEIQETVSNVPAGVPAPNLALQLKSESTDDGIKLTYRANFYMHENGSNYTSGQSGDGHEVVLSITKGVMVRYSTENYPTNIKDGMLAFVDEDLFTRLSDGKITAKDKSKLVTGLTSNQTYYFTAFPYSTYNVYNEIAARTNISKCQWTGTKGTLTVTITQDYDYKTLGEITVTATPTAGGDPVSASRTGAGNVALSLDGGEYTVSFSAYDNYTAPENQTINVTAGQNNTASAEYKIVVGLENYTWEEVQAIAAGGDAKHFFSVGDKKTTSVGTVGNSNNYGTIYTDGDILGGNIVLKNLEATIVAINAHQTTSGTKNNVTFCVLDMPLRCKDQTGSMNWGQSCLRTCLNERKSEFLPEIHQYLIEVYNTYAGFNVYDDDTGRKSYKCNDYIYVPSISNASSASAVYDVMEQNAGGTHYPYFSSNEKRTLKSWEKEGTKIWVTSTVQSGKGYLVDISASGFVYFSNAGSNDYITADVTWKPMCFNIG